MYPCTCLNTASFLTFAYTTQKGISEIDITFFFEVRHPRFVIEKQTYVIYVYIVKTGDR
jgi:hypothetical protein